MAAYYGATTAVDEQFGRILGGLEELGMAEDTIVVVSSDHGDMLGSQGLPLKRKPWEESIRVPGIVRYPRRVKAGRTEEALVSHIDFAPTLLGLCGAPVPRAMQGTNLAGLVLGTSRRGAESVFFQIFGPYAGDRTEAGWRGVRTSRYMYAQYRSRPWVLYDLEQDPYELENLVAREGLRSEMEGRLAAWMQQTGDSWEFNWTDPVEDKGRLYTGGTYYTVAEYLAAQK